MKEISEKEGRTKKIKKYNNKIDMIGMITSLIMAIFIGFGILIIIKGIRPSGFGMSSGDLTSIISIISLIFIVWIFKVVYTAICDHIIEKLYTEESMDRQTQCLIELFGKSNKISINEEVNESSESKSYEESDRLKAIYSELRSNQSK